jgi:hypothetical protein
MTDFSGQYNPENSGLEWFTREESTQRQSD